MKKNILIILFVTNSFSVFGQWSGNDSKSENGGSVRRVQTETKSSSKTKFYYEINLTNSMAKVYGDQYESGMKDYFTKTNNQGLTAVTLNEFDNFGFDQHLGWHIQRPNSMLGLQLGFGIGFGTSSGVIKESGVSFADASLDMGYIDMEANLTYDFYQANGISAYGFGGLGLGAFHTFDETIDFKSAITNENFDHTEYTSMKNLNFGVGADLSGFSLKGTITVPISSLDLTSSTEASILDKETFKDDLPTFFSIRIGYRI